MHSQKQSASVLVSKTETLQSQQEQCFVCAA